MNPILIKLILAISSSKTVRKVVVELLDGMSHRTDNMVDDELVHAIARALEIRIPTHDDTMKLSEAKRLEDGNIFLPNDELESMKRSRKRGPRK